MWSHDERMDVLAVMPFPPADLNSATFLNATLRALKNGLRIDTYLMLLSGIVLNWDRYPSTEPKVRIERWVVDNFQLHLDLTQDPSAAHQSSRLHCPEVILN